MRTITFFSFKGGVGRTNLLLNAAYALAQRGSFVVVADWDLHAPGLSIMADMAQPDPEPDCSPPYDVRAGVLDFLDGLLPFDPESTIPDPLSMVQPTRLAHKARAKEDGFTGDIWFIPAGPFDPADENNRYHALLRQLQGQDFSESAAARKNFPQIIRLFCEQVEKVRNPAMEDRPPDYLLIDARTGMTEIGDMVLSGENNTIQRMVLVTGFNDQNLGGLEVTLRALRKQILPGEMCNRLTIAVSPVPQGEELLKQQRFLRLNRLIAGLARDIGHGEKETMPKMHSIPYHPRIALSEALMVQEFPDSEPAKAIQILVDAIRIQTESFPEESERKRRLLVDAGPALEKILDHKPKEGLGGRLPIFPHPPWSQQPVWNWPDPSVGVKEFAPLLSSDHSVLLNGLARTISLAEKDILAILDNLPQMGALQRLSLIQTLRAEFSQFGETDRNSWIPQFNESFAHWVIWLNLWCQKMGGDRDTILQSVLSGDRDDVLGVWPKIGYFWFLLARFLAENNSLALAERAYQKSQALDPDFVWLWIELGNVLSDQPDRLQEAESLRRCAPPLPCMD